jgi:TRAP-type C4-dicarboxylate transport system permease small subunit
MRAVGNLLALLALGYLIIPAFLFVHVTGSNNISSTTFDRVMATVGVFLFWGMIVFYSIRSHFRGTNKRQQVQSQFTYTYVPEKRENLG